MNEKGYTMTDINAGNSFPQQDKFLLQVNEDPLLPIPRLNEFANDGLEAIRFQMWKDRDYLPKVTAVPFEDIDLLDCSKWQGCIPIGTIEFVEKVMKKVYHVSQIKPVNIPLALQQKRFYKRRVAYAPGVEAVRMLYDDLGVDELFVKSYSRLKTDFTGVYKKSDSSEPYASEPMLLVSEVLPMRTDRCSEWRAFVHHGKVLDIKNYSGNPWVLPDRSLVEDMAKTAGDLLKACTVDVMVTDDGETALVEVHNFISCGSYGAELPLSMYKQAFLQEVTERG